MNARSLLFTGLALLGTMMPGLAQTPSTGEMEAQRCEEKIATVQREVLNRYEDALGELQAGFQKAADLDGALAVRAERQRVSKEGTLTEKSLVPEPKSLRALQGQILAKLQELTSQLVLETLPRLLEAKKALTISGKLDEAVAVRGAIERLQNNYLPITRPDPSIPIPADLLVQSYSADRSRADKTYKGQRVTVRGVYGGFRQDPADPKHYVVYIGGSSGAWVQCYFPVSEYRIREEKQFNATVTVIAPKDNEAGALRVQKGQSVDLRGTCDGWDETVRLTKCDLAR